MTKSRDFNQMNALSVLFRTKALATLIRLLFGPNQRSMYLAEMIDVTGIVSRSLEVEISILKHLGLIVGTRDRSRIYYAANPRHPLYDELCGIVEKSADLAGALQEALAVRGVECAFLVSGPEISTDPDQVVIVRQGAHLDVAPFTNAVAKRFHVALIHHIFTCEDLAARFARNDPTVTSLLSAPKTFVVGRAETLQSLLRAPNGELLAPAEKEAS